MIWHDINCRDRILKWRQWRNTLATLNLEDCLKEVSITWAKAPQVNHYLIPDDIKEWPDPWNLINDNIYCDLSIALGIFYTLTLSDNSNINNIHIEIYKTNNDWVNLCSVNDGLYMLNYIPGGIVNKSTIPNLGNPNFSYSKIDLANKLN